ncbi:ImmA/IrrE family metallo-endopeptidase [Thermus altitudinis]|uniref:ImmA/IrrE family metallo-endopeptidase n=1 Tax=Thermus altitudinis TaxID=2908145 RepID=UPI001FAAB63E|nr:ImmA/IrrE family metallo-endopeptidase [Thermus altitudinis]
MRTQSARHELGKIANALRRRREELGLGQEEVAEALGVSRESLAQWERGERLPPTLHLQGLAQIYGVDEKGLLRGELRYKEALEVLLPRGLPLSAKARLELERWLGFLDAYADFLQELGEALPREIPLKELRERFLTDVRQASSRARAVRERLGLGHGALPNLWTLLDGLGVLVYRASLGEGDVPIWGAYYRHPRLGPAILVNADSTSGRQVFTLAHELAHTLYHARLPGILCRREVIPEEREVEAFANAWAAHFLVPAPALRKEAGKLRKLSPEAALFLASHFGVSYTFILYRLLNEGLITEENLLEWARISPNELAVSIGLSAEPFRFPSPTTKGGLHRFPPSVLTRVRDAVYEGKLSVSEASGLLDVDSTTLQRDLLRLPKGAEAEELGEFDQELRFRTPGRKPKPLNA